MLDKPEKTRELMAILQAAAPFKVALMPDLIDHLARQQKPVVVKPIETVSGSSPISAMWAALPATFSPRMPTV